MSEQTEIAALKEQVANLRLANAGLNSRLTNSVDLHNAVVVENNELKAMVDVAKEVLHSLDDDIYGAHALGDDLFNKFKAAFNGEN